MKKGIEVILRDGGLYTISEKQIEYWQYIYPELDIRSEIEFLKTQWDIDKFPRKTAKNISKFINKWLYKQNKEDL